MTKKFLTLTLTLAVCLTSLAQVNAHAAEQKMTPATHMWVRTGVNSVVYVPVGSLEQCIMLTRQAANINSSDSVCYFKDTLLNKIDCQKSTKRGEQPNCKVE